MTKKQLGTYILVILLITSIINQLFGIYTVWCYMEMCGRGLLIRILTAILLFVPITIIAAIAKEAVTVARKLK